MHTTQGIKFKIAFMGIQYFVTKLGFLFSCRHCECLPPKYPENCQGQKDAKCRRDKECGPNGFCNRPNQFGPGTGQVVNNG